jgi:hypothetical protein
MLPAEPSAPARAARETALAALQELPRRRRVTLGVLGWSMRPGLTVTPWTLRGALDALEVLELGLESIALLGDPAASRAVLDRVLPGSSGAGAWQSEERRLGLSMPGHGRPARIPSAWVGTSLCLLAPLAYRPAARSSPGRGAPRAWFGPVRSALATLAGACGIDPPGEGGVAAGARLVQEVFAGSCLVLDATWWSALDPAGEWSAHPVAPEHCLATSDAALEGAAVAIDAWLTQLLQLPPPTSSPRSLAIPRVTGRRRAWPRARLPVGAPSRERRIGPLRSPGPPGAPDTRPASIRRAPGSFGTAWRRWGSRTP